MCLPCSNFLPPSAGAVAPSSDVSASAASPESKAIATLPNKAALPMKSRPGQSETALPFPFSLLDMRRPLSQFFPDSAGTVASSSGASVPAAAPVLPASVGTVASSSGAPAPVAAPETKATAALPDKPVLPMKSSKKSKKQLRHNLPQQSGLVVQHRYHDHSSDPTSDPSLVKHKAKGGVITPFPVKLHDMLDKIEADGLAHVVSWQPHGRCFVVHLPKEFVNHVMPHYFKQTKMASFQRQLNLYGFNRLTSGPDKGGYYHEMFLRGRVSLAFDIHRMRVKGTGVRLPTNPDDEPNFYALPPVWKAGAPLAVVAAMPPLPPPAFPPPPCAAPLRVSSDHTLNIERAMPQQQQRPQNESDVVFFEGLPFHYLDPSALPSVPKPSQTQSMAASQPHPSQDRQTAPPPPVAGAEGSLIVRPSSTVTESDEYESDGTDDVLPDDAPLPSFAPLSMDWDGPLSCPALQAHMRRSSFRSFATDGAALGTSESRPAEEDIESFFRGFDMSVDVYHERIEQIGDDDDDAFGYLLEQAISE